MPAALICNQRSLSPDNFSSYPSTCFWESRELTSSASSCKRRASMMVRPRTSTVTLKRLAKARLASWMRPRSSKRSSPSTMLLKRTSIWVWICWSACRCSSCKASTSFRKACRVRKNLPRHQRCRPARAASERAVRKDQSILRNATSRRGLDEAVADAAHRIEVFGGRAKLFAQPAHVRIDGAGVHEAVVFPDIAQQLVPGLHASAALRQNREQLELGRRQLHVLAAPLHHVPRRVDKQVAKLERLGFRRRGPAALQDLFHAQNQLARAEGVGDVIVRTQLQADDAVHLRRFGGEHNDGNAGGGGVAAQHFADFQPIDFGQHQVE